MKIGLQAYIKGSTDAIDFYQKAFGTVLGYNVRNADGTYMHAELYLGDQMFGPLPWNACCANVIDRFGVFWYISI